MRVLYVEDNPRDADLTARVLGKSAPDVQLEVVSSIAEALTRLDQLEANPLDVVLVDVHLRGGDGLSLLRYIREHSFPVAVVVVTGMGDEETAVAALKARADDYVVKRKDYLDRLPTTLESALSHHRADRARRAHPLKVLYVETDLRTIEATRQHFAVHADYIQLDIASTVSEALLALRARNDDPSYDVLLLDFDVTELNAIEVLKELRVTHEQDLPVVLLCNVGDEELALQSRKLGASSYLLKGAGYLYQLPWQLEEAYSNADLRRREAELKASEARNRALLNAIPDLMFLLSRDGTFIDFNAPDPALLLVPPDQFLGKKMQDLLPPQLIAQVTEGFEQAFSSDKPVILEYTLPFPDGNHVFESSIVTCDGDKILTMVRDITQRKQAEESLRKALAEVQQLKDRLHEENVYLQEEIRVASNFGEIIGRSDPLQRVLHKAEQVAPLDTTVLILGETGTGKELLAHAIHSLSPRHEHPLVKLNCAVLPPTLIESELFGHEKGAFTGADAQRSGRFEVADGGTLFLDEVGELPLDLQGKLLRVLEEGEFERVGSSRTLAVDVRVIAATNRDLVEAVRNGTFRSDLYYRLSIFPITLPPLRERREDIPMLVTHMVKHLSAKFGKQIDTISQETMSALKKYSWPGNIRELRNVIERAVIITKGSSLRLIDRLDSHALESAYLSDLEASKRDTDYETLEGSEYNLILSTLKKVHWRVEGVGGAADLLAVNPSTLRSRMRKLGIVKPRIEHSVPGH